MVGWLILFGLMNYEPSRLFLTPTSDILPSRYLSISGGSATYRFEDKFLIGSINFGLGDIGEIELSIGGFFTNLMGGILNVPATALKIRLHRYLTIMLKSSPFGEQTKSYYLQADEAGAWAGAGMYSYFMKYGSISVLGDYKLEDCWLYLNLFVGDYRMRSVYETGEERENHPLFIGGSLGLSSQLKEDVKLIIEYGRLPKLLYYPEIKLKPFDIILAGIRFWFSSNISLDIAGTYSSDARGLADLIIHSNIAVVFPLVGD